jgi:flagellar protein FliS
MSKNFKKYSNIDAKQLTGIDDPKVIIYELLNGLNKKLKLTISDIDKGKLETAKVNAKKAQNIAFALRKTLDFQNGGEVAENLNFIYGHIHAATEKFIANDKNDLMTSAYFASSEILDGWKGLVEKTA